MFQIHNQRLNLLKNVKRYHPRVRRSHNGDGVDKKLFLKTVSKSLHKLGYLRFADDILLISGSLESITQMITDLSIAASNAGLSLHPEKTKNLRNRWTANRNVPAQVIANGMEIEVLGVDGNTKYLGRKFTFADPHRTEMESRISSAWKTVSYAQAGVDE